MSIKPSDKRRHLRYDLVDFALLDADGLEHPIQCVIVDISLGGLQIRSKVSLPLGKQCVLRVARPKDRPIEIKGEVRHCQLMEESELFASGFRFLPDTREERMAIAEYVHEIFLRQTDAMAG
jgi:c-di-GMP-binding flagellar brake protein YcgR